MTSLNQRYGFYSSQSDSWNMHYVVHFSSNANISILLTPYYIVAFQDVMRILIATDNHLGYADKTPEKEDDSFDTFEEILQIALEQEVDFVLLGGDLFHENKPSRQTEMRAIQVTNKHKPILMSTLLRPTWILLPFF